jgi:hypothetical protein
MSTEHLNQPDKTGGNNQSKRTNTQLSFTVVFAHEYGQIGTEYIEVPRILKDHKPVRLPEAYEALIEEIRSTL